MRTQKKSWGEQSINPEDKIFHAYVKRSYGIIVDNFHLPHGRAIWWSDIWYLDLVEQIVQQFNTWEPPSKYLQLHSYP